MKTYILEIDGNLSLFETYPALEILWHKSQYGTYCYSARILCNSEIKEGIAEVTIDTKYIKAPGKSGKRTLDIPVTRFLPCAKINGLTQLPINDPELLKAIELCEFTKSKGKNSKLVRYATGIRLRYSNAVQTFSFFEGLPPKLMCKDFLSPLKTNDKIITRLNLI